MNQSELKNMIVLKNLPSNIIEEAIVVLKENKKIKKLEKIENNKNLDGRNIEKKQEGYILKEAEMLITNYISNIEDKRKKKNTEQKKMNLKYKRLKIYAFISSCIIAIETITLLIK